jgi:hypothetical protein
MMLYLLVKGVKTPKPDERSSSNPVVAAAA